MALAEIEGVEVEAATVMIAANVVDPQEAERGVPEDIRLIQRTLKHASNEELEIHQLNLLSKHVVTVFLFQNISKMYNLSYLYLPFHRGLESIPIHKLVVKK